MALIKQRTLYATILGLACTALGIDRFFMPTSLTGPSAANADQSSLAVDAAPIKTAAAKEAGDLPLQPMQSVADRLSEVRTSLLPEQMSLVDAFMPPASWDLERAETAKKVKEDAQAKKAPTPEVEAFKPTLSFVLMTSNGAIAKVDGAQLKVGDTHKGFKLVEITKQAVVFEKDGQRVAIAIPRTQTK